MTDLATWAIATVAASGVSGIVSAAGVLGSQLINARHSLKAKRLERFTAYHTLLEAASKYSLEKSEPGYQRYLAAAQAALIVSSKRVAELLGTGALSTAI